MKILIVDDEQIAIEGIMANIRFEEYGITEVLTANSMHQAQETLKKTSVDITMCDIEMPNGSGLELLKWINEYDKGIVKIILSCHNEFEFAQQAVELSCMQYILKPATPDVLQKAMEKATGRVRTYVSQENIRKMGERYVEQVVGQQWDEISAVEQVQRYITEHIAEELSVEKLAKMVYLSQNHLTRSFKKKYGKTIVEYISDCRLNLAEELLKNTNLTVTMVSAKVGYPNYAYFTKQFKKHSGHSPRTFRELYGIQK